MSVPTWLFLYLAGLVELDTRYRLSGDHGLPTFIGIVPLLVMAVRPTQRRALQWMGVVMAIACSLIMARMLSLDFWDTQRVDLALLSAGVGLGGLLAVRDDQLGAAMSVVNWTLVGLGWLLALWHPLGPWIAMGPAASLALWSRAGPAPIKDGGLSPGWLLFWIGMAIAKPWWDSEDWGEWVVALWAFGVAGSYLPKVRDLRLPWPLALIALLPLSYPWTTNWLWGPVLGLLSGLALQRTARPWPRLSAYALLAGMLLSYVLHSNLELFGPLVWGSR